MSQPAIKRKPTIQDIARRAGVGAATVSRVLNKRDNVSDSVRVRVQQVIDELGYRPSFAARHMRTQRSLILGFVSDRVATTPYAGAIIQGAQEVAWAEGRVLMVVDAGRSPADTRAAVEALLERQVEGIIYAAMFHHVVHLPSNMDQVPTVLANCAPADQRVPSVVPDEVAAGRDATNLLLARGHTRVGFVNVYPIVPGIPASIGRLQGYREALAAANLPYDDSIVRHGNGDAASGYTHTHAIMQHFHPPTALFCGNDRTAMGAYNALQELDLRVPDDVAVVGFDNQEIIASALRPGLTTLQLPHDAMGRWAAERVLQRISSLKPQPPEQHTLVCPVVLRGSL